MLTGELPFRGTHRMLLHQVLNDEPRAPRRLNDRIPRDLETVCLKALAKEPARRYQSAGELAADLRRFLAGEPVQARPISRRARLWRWCKRNPAVAALTAAVVVLLVAGAVVSASFAIYYAGVSQALTRARDQANADAEAARLARNTAEGALAAEKVALTEKNAALVEKEGALKREADSKDIAQMHLGRLLVEKGLSLYDTDPSGAILHFDAAYRADHDDPVRADLHRLRLATYLRQQQPRLVHLWSLGHAIESVTYSPDGRRVLVLGRTPPGGSASADSAARVWDRVTGQPLTPVLRHPGGVAKAQFLLDGRRVLTSGLDRTWRLWDALTGEPLTPLWPSDTLAFHPVGLPFASESRDPRLVLWVPEAGGQGSLRILDVETGKPMSPLLPTEGMPTAVHGVAGIPRLLVLSRTGDKHLLRLWNLETAQQVPLDLPPLTLAKYRTLRVFFTPDRNRFCTFHEEADRTRCEARLWDLRTGKATTPVMASEGEAWSFHFNKDGSRLLTVSSKEIQTWDAVTGQRLGPAIRYGFEGETTYSGTGSGKLWTLLVTPKGNDRKKLKHLCYNTETLAVSELPLDAAVKFVWDRNLPAGVDRPRMVLLLSPDTTPQTNWLQLWDSDKGQPIDEPIKLPERVQSVESAPEGRLLVYYGSRGVQLFATEPALHSEGQVASFELSSTATYSQFVGPGKSAVMGVNELHGVRVWEVVPGTGLVPGKVSEPVASLGPRLRERSVKTRDPGGTRVLIGHERGLHLWEPATGASAALTAASLCKVATFSPDGATVIAGTDNGTILVWDLTGNEPTLPTAPITVAPLASWVSPDGRQGRLLVEAAGTWQIVDASSGALVSKLPSSFPTVASAEFSADGRRLLVVGTHKTQSGNVRILPLIGDEVRIWEVAPVARGGTRIEEGKEIVLPASSTSGDRRAVLSPEGYTVYSADGRPGYSSWLRGALGWSLYANPRNLGNGVRAVRVGPTRGERWLETNEGLVFFLNDGNLPPRLTLGPDETMLDVTSISEQHSLVLTALDEKTLRVWNADSGQPAGEPIALSSRLVAADFVDPMRLYTLEESGALRQWDRQSGREWGSLTREIGRFKRVIALNAYTLLVVAEDGGVRLESVLPPTNRPVSLAVPSPATSAVLYVQAGVQRLATLHEDGKVRIWDALTGKPLGVAVEQDGGITSMVLNDTLVVTIGPGGARIWKSDGTPVGERLPHDGPVLGAGFWSGGVLTWGPESIRLWSSQGTPFQASFKPEGRVQRVFPLHSWMTLTPTIPLVVVTGNQAQLWDARTGKPLLPSWKCPPEVEFMDWGPNSGVYAANRDSVWCWSVKGVREPLAAGGDPPRPAVWPLQGKVMKLLVRSVGQQRAALIIHGDEARLVNAYRFPLAAPASPPLRHGARIVHAAFGISGPFASASHDRVVTVGVDGVARLWIPGLSKPLAELRQDGPITQATFVYLLPTSQQLSWQFTRFLMTVGGKEVRLWDPATGEPASMAPAGQRAPEGRAIPPFVHTAEVREGILTENPRSNLASSRWQDPYLTTRAGTEARLWDLTTGQAAGPPLQHDCELDGVWIAGRRIATLDRKGVVHLWDGLSGKKLGEPLRHPEPILFVSLREAGGRGGSPHDAGGQVLTFSASSARLWDGTSGQPLCAPEKFGPVPGPAFSTARSSVLLTGTDGSVRLWDWPGFQYGGESILADVPVQRPFSPSVPVTAYFSPAGDRVVTISAARVLRLWDTEGKLVAGPRFINPFLDQPTRIPEFSPDGRYLALPESPLRFLETASGRELPLALAHTTDPVARQLNCLSGALLASRASDPFLAAAFVQATRGAGFDNLLPGRIDRVRFLPDGRHVLATVFPPRQSLTVLRGDLETGKVEPLSLPPLHTPILTFAVSPDGARIAIVAANWPTASLWMFDLQSARTLLGPITLGDRPGFRASSTSLTFSPDGRSLVLGWLGTTRVWDVTTSRPLTPPLPGVPPDQPFSPDGRRLTTIQNTEARLWDAATGQPLSPPFPHPESIKHAAFSPDGRRLIVTGAQQMRVWDVADDGRTLEELSLAARIQAGRELDSTVNLVSLDARQLKDSWEQLLRGPNPFLRPARAMRTWHRVELERASSAKNWAAILAHTTWLIEAEPDEWQWLAYRGRARLHLKQVEGARTDYERALACGRTAMQDWLDKEAQGHESRKEREQALFCLDRLSSVRTGQIRWLLRRVALNIALERWDQVGADLDRALAVEPSSTRGQLQFLVADAERRKEWTQAVLYLDRLIALEPGNGSYLLRRAAAQETLGHTALADRDYRKALAVDLEAARADHDRQIQNFERTKDVAQVVACFDRLIEAVPSSGKYHDGRAWAYFRLQNWERAVADYTRAIDLGADKDLGQRAWVLWYNRGSAQASLGQWDKAAADFAASAQRKPAPAHALFLLGVVRLQQGDDKGYRQACADLLDQFGKTGDAGEANTVAWACAVTPDAVADYERPVALARLAVRAAAKNYNTLNTLGTILYRAGKDEEAIETLAEALQAHGKGGAPVDWLILALAHQRSGRPEQGRRWFDKAIAELERKEFSASLSWSARIELRQMRREAEGVFTPAP
jgi:WD40 repeat protein/tetratricopeptide (TPR) repeat protein